MNILRRRFIAGVLTLWAAPVLAQRPKRRPNLNAVGADLVDAAQLGGISAFAVADLTSGQMLAEHNSGMAMPPASVTKAVTALFALGRLGADHRFITRVMMVGTRRGAVLDGDLILVGGGDPSLDTDRMGDLAAALAQTGLHKITGRFYFDDSALPYHARIAVGQPDYVGYNPAINGLMLNYNRVNFVWAPVNGGWQTEMNAEGARFIPPVRAAQVTVAQRDTPLFAYDADTPIERWSVAEPALGKGGSRWLPLRHPAIYAAEVFQTLCAAQGISLPNAVQMVGALPVTAVVLVQDQSASLAELLRGMLKYSTNLTAEAIGLAASGAASQAQSAQIMTLWTNAQFGTHAVFGDHSGLGPITTCTAGDMLRILMGADKLPPARALMGLLREGGISNAEGREDKASPVRIHAKSGTLNFVSGLAGYVRAPNGKALVFAIFSADNPRRAALDIEDREDPEGGQSWTKRARKMQRLLIANWARRWL